MTINNQEKKFVTDMRLQAILAEAATAAHRNMFALPGDEKIPADRKDKSGHGISYSALPDITSGIITTVKREDGNLVVGWALREEPHANSNIPKAPALAQDMMIKYQETLRQQMQQMGVQPESLASNVAGNYAEIKFNAEAVDKALAAMPETSFDAALKQRRLKTDQEKNGWAYNVG